MRKRFALLAAAAAVMLSLMMMPLTAQAEDFRGPAPEADEADRAEDGFTVNGIDISGMTVEEARAALQEQRDALGAHTCTVTLGDKSATAHLSDFGIEWEDEGVLEKIVSQGKCAGLIGRYKALKDMRAGEMDITIPYTIKPANIREFVTKNMKPLDTVGVDGALTREKGEFIVTPSVDGICVDVEGTVKLIYEAAMENLDQDLNFDTVFEYIRPAITTEMLEAVKDELGTCTTYAKGTDNRAANIALGTSRINGLLLLPGQSASTSDMMLERIAENGYKMAPQYMNGSTLDAVGGGVCQVSSTLYNALLRAELQIDERHSHSMSVSYLEPSFDAAIAWQAKDLRFTNNKEYPVYIEGYMKGRDVTFTVYGFEDRPANRKVVYKSIVDKEVPAEDKIVYDPTQPVGYTAKKGQRHNYIESHLIKIVYVDGEEVSRETINKDTYYPQYVTITIGTMEVPVETVPAETTAAPPA